MKMENLKKSDPKLYRFLQAEILRQKETIDLIPSENIASLALLETIGSPLTNKYSEGYPGKRYYPGNKYCDEIETLAKERALKVFGLKPEEWSANVQPYSGSPANLEVYFALLNFGDTMMGMGLAAGGHLTHGHKVNFSGRGYKSIQYGVNPATGLLDYDEIEYLAKKHKPKVIVSGLTAYPRKINFKKFGEIARKVGAYHLADISHIAGLVAAGLHQSPFSYADAVMTTTHKTLRGPRGAVIFARKSEIFTLPNFQRKIGRARNPKSETLISEAVDRAVFPGMQGGPHNNVTAAIALMFGEALKPVFKKYQTQIVKNAAALAEALKINGASLITGGTDNHLLLMDARTFGLDGLTAQKRLEEVGILANRNSIPGDDKPFKPSGIRMGTPAVTTRGMKEKEMVKIAELIDQVLRNEKMVSYLKKEVLKLCGAFPLPY